MPLLILTAIAAAVTLVGTACGRSETVPPVAGETVTNHGVLPPSNVRSPKANRCS